MPRSVAFGAVSHERIAAKSNALSHVLKHCSKRELEMLIRYYVNGEEESHVLADMDASAEEFARLRASLRKRVGSETPPRARSAAAGR